jgi:hypothetical protein
MPLAAITERRPKTAAYVNRDRRCAGRRYGRRLCQRRQQLYLVTGDAASDFGVGALAEDNCTVRVTATRQAVPAHMPKAAVLSK